jgi:predicted AlkP superfamily phosphohydrolase/phosphomutase
MSDAYPGEPIDHLPDLLIEWDRGAPVSTVYSPKTGTIRDQWAGNRTGDHQASGLLIAAGPGFGSERLSSAVDVTQIGPTIAALLGVTLADGTSAPVARASERRRRSQELVLSAYFPFSARGYPDLLGSVRT